MRRPLLATANANWTRNGSEHLLIHSILKSLQGGCCLSPFSVFTTSEEKQAKAATRPAAHAAAGLQIPSGAGASQPGPGVHADPGMAPGSSTSCLCGPCSQGPSGAESGPWEVLSAPLPSRFSPCTRSPERDPPELCTHPGGRRQSPGLPRDLNTLSLTWGVSASLRHTRHPSQSCSLFATTEAPSSFLESQSREAREAMWHRAGS